MSVGSSTIGTQRPSLSDRTGNILERVERLEALVGLRPAEFRNTYVADGTHMETLVASTPPGPIVFRGYKLSNLHATLPAIVAFYDLADPGDIDDSTQPTDVIAIPRKLTANLDGPGIDNYENGFCFALWKELDATSGGESFDFDGSGPDQATLLISLAWDSGTPGP